jgi:hypothetical protein
MAWLTSWLFHPAMLAIGAAAIAAPIIIHLLNKRRFRIVDWAAMEFLLDADKKNRRRVRLEELLLLALRSLALLLLGLLLARPFLSSSLAEWFGDHQRLARIVVWDDSLSTQVSTANRTAMDVARDSLKQMLERIARDANEDYLTVILATDPDEPRLTGEPVTPETLPNLIRWIEDRQATDLVANYPAALQTASNQVARQPAGINSLVYVLSDLRRRDWAIGDESAAAPATDETPAAGPAALVDELADQASGAWIVDIGSPVEDNLAILDVRADDLPVANTLVRFSVRVANRGPRRAENLEVRLQIDDQPPMVQRIATLAPGQVEVASFRYLFPDQIDRRRSFDDNSTPDDFYHEYRVAAEVLPAQAGSDVLAADSTAYFATHVLDVLPVLVVDGDPSPDPERSESHFLTRLGVPGTGIAVDTITASELETAPLTRYRVIFLCNVDEISDDRRRVLEQWTRQGGGLVLMPADRVRRQTFNSVFFRDGEGLSPIELLDIRGDPTLSRWVSFEVVDRQHPALRVTGDRDVDLGAVEVFSWWHARLAEGPAAGAPATPSDESSAANDIPDATPRVQLRLSDPDKSVAMVERRYGDGRVIAMTVGADGDWTLWPGHPTYICIMWDLVNDLVGNPTANSATLVGGSLSQVVDLARFSQYVTLVDPAGQKFELTAAPLDDTEAARTSVLYHVRYPDVARRGFYEMSLARQDGQTDTALFAVNVDPAESDLTRVETEAGKARLLGDRASIVSPDDIFIQQASRATNEWWPQILVLLGVVLGVEQLAGWWFGKRRWSG